MIYISSLNAALLYIQQQSVAALFLSVCCLMVHLMIYPHFIRPADANQFSVLLPGSIDLHFIHWPNTLGPFGPNLLTAMVPTGLLTASYISTCGRITRNTVAMLFSRDSLGYTDDFLRQYRTLWSQQAVV